MNRHLRPRALVRANWFAELSSALDDGERLLNDLIAEGVSPIETHRLRSRLIELRAELERLNHVKLAGQRVVGPGWPSGSSPGGANATDWP